MPRMSNISSRRTMVSRRLLSVSTALLLLPGAVQAQSVNYAELEQMFGEPVTTSVTGKPQRASEAATSLIIITRDDIRRSPSSDIPGLLKSYAGIDVSHSTASQSDVAIRGGVQPNNPSLLVLLNGRQVYLEHYNLVTWDAIGVQIEEIQQIEVVKGPNSALFGFNAASGVVNIITINPLQSQQATATVETTSEGDRRVSVTLAQKLARNIGVRISAGYERGDELDRISAADLLFGGSVVNPSHKKASGELYMQIDDRTEASIGGTWSDSSTTQLVPGIILFRNDYNLSSIGGRISRDMGWGTLSGSLYKNWMEIRFGEPAAGPGIATDPNFATKTMVAAADALWRFGLAHTLRFGLEYRTNQLREAGGYPGLTRYTVAAANGMWEYQLNDRFRLTLAGRIDHLQLDHTGLNAPTIWTDADYDRNLTAWSFNGSILAALDANSSLRIAGGRGVQLPSLLEFGSRTALGPPIVPFPFVFSGNPYLKPTVVWSGEIGYTRNIASDGARFELTAFFTKTDDLGSLASTTSMPRAAPPASPFIVWTAENIGGIKSYGVEASLSGKIQSAWSWRANYSWTKVDQNIAGNEGGMLQWPFIFGSSTPRHKLNAQLSYEHGPFLATLLGRYTSDTKQLAQPASIGSGLREAHIDDSFALDAKLGLRVHKNITFTLTGENLTGTNGATLSPFGAERRLRAGAKVQF